MVEISLVFFILCLNLILAPCELGIPLRFDENVHNKMESNAACLTKIARRYFREGSSFCMVQSGNIHQNLTNHNVLKSTYMLTLHKIMNDLKWSIIIKQPSSHIMKEVIVSILSLKMVFGQIHVSLYDSVYNIRNSRQLLNFYEICTRFGKCH